MHPLADRRPEAWPRPEALSWVAPPEAWAAAEGAACAVTVDVNIAYLAASGRLPLGLTAPRDMTAAEVAAFNADPAAALHPGRGQFRAGVFLAEVDGLAEALDPRLPCPLTRTGTWPTAPIPLHAPMLRYAAELGGRVRVTAGAVYDSTGPALDPWHDRLADAYREALAAAGITRDMAPADYLAAYDRLDADHPEAAVILAVVKAMARGGIGRLAAVANADRRRWFRPDHRAHVIAAATAGVHRKIVKTLAATGVPPLAVQTDAITYPAEAADALAVVPLTLDGGPVPGCLRVGPAPGWVKLHHAEPMADASAAAAAGNNPADAPADDPEVTE
jgi:hypothetical protein